MKRFIKIARMVALAAILGVVGLISFVEFMSWRSERQVTALVTDLAPGTPFATAIACLGPPTQTITDSQEMRLFNRPIEQRVIPDSKLYLFVHGGLPYRWVLVYTDSASQIILHAEWQHM